MTDRSQGCLQTNLADTHKTRLIIPHDSLGLRTYNRCAQWNQFAQLLSPLGTACKTTIPQHLRTCRCHTCRSCHHRTTLCDLPSMSTPPPGEKVNLPCPPGTGRLPHLSIPSNLPCCDLRHMPCSPGHPSVPDTDPKGKRRTQRRSHPPCDSQQDTRNSPPRLRSPAPPCTRSQRCSSGR